MFCPHCGKDIPDGSRFCPNCGKEIFPSNTNNMQKNGTGKPKKKKWFKKLLIAAALVFGISIIFDIIGGEDDSNVFNSSDYAYSDDDYTQGSNEDESSSGTTDFTNDETASSDSTTWTVMLYMCGADLESDGGEASSDMVDIAKQATNDKVHFIAQTGGSKAWQKGISSDELQRYELTNGEFSLVDHQKLASMGSPKTLASFIQWGKKKYPADRYMILFWDHGSGAAYGVCFDELFDNDSLSIIDLAQGLKSGGVKFDVIGFDTCLTATIETEYAISPYGKYCCASEETEPGEGWNYTAWTSYLAQNNGTGIEQFGKVLVDSYMKLCTDQGTNDSATLSFVNLKKIGNVYNAFVKMSSEMSDVSSNVTSFRQITKEATRTQYFGTRTENEGYTNMIDLGDLARNTNEVLSNSASEVLSAIENAVVYERHGDDRGKAMGISVFYPVNSDASELDHVAAGTTNGPYLAFLDAMCDYWQAPSWVYEASAKKSKNDIRVSRSFNPVRSKNYSVNFTENIDSDGIYTVQITSGLDIVDSINFDLVYVSSDGNKSVYLGADNNIDSDWDNGIFKDNFNGTWLTIGGEYVNENLIEEGDDYNLYSVPVKLNGNETNLRIRYDFNTEKYKLIGAYDGIDNSGAVSRKLTKLKDGDKLVFLFDAYDIEHDKQTQREMGSITYSSNTQISDEALKDGDYLYTYYIYDVFGNEHETKGVDMEVKNGEITVYELEDDDAQ